MLREKNKDNNYHSMFEDEIYYQCDDCKWMLHEDILVSNHFECPHCTILIWDKPIYEIGKKETTVQHQFYMPHELEVA